MNKYLGVRTLANVLHIVAWIDLLGLGGGATLMASNIGWTAWLLVGFAFFSFVIVAASNLLNIAADVGEATERTARATERAADRLAGQPAGKAA